VYINKTASVVSGKHTTLEIAMEQQLHVLLLCLTLLVISVSDTRAEQYISAVGDPGMRRDGLRVAFEAWNFCNEVGEEAPGMGSPRAADCFDFSSEHVYLHGRKSKNKQG
jgi:hypothetical protein